MKTITRILIFLIIFSVGLGVGSAFLSKNAPANNIISEKDTPRAFVSEIYDKIKENYWDNISDNQLLDLFKASITQNGGVIDTEKIESKDKLLNIVSSNISQMNEDQRTKFITGVTGSVLASLNPSGRSGLYTQKLETQLQNTVNNINPQADLYKNLGLSKGASESAIEQAYQQKSEQLKKENTPTSQEELKQLSYSRDVLTKPDTKLRYDNSQIEPTIFTKVINGGILYMQFKKFSPTSYDEFLKAFDLFKNYSTPSVLIFDLRGNIGGAIDATPYFLGNFIGKNQPAFEFYHKGEYLPFKTPTEKLSSISKYKQVVILVDNQTQSSAEIMAASLKKYHVGIVVGVPTKGWGTVERVFPLDNQISKTEKYSLFLVHSITLRDDNQPIEGRGVDPDVNIKSADWEQQLFSYFRNNQLAEAIKSIL